MPILRHALAALLIVTLHLPGAATAAFSNLYVFGDSLSDNGNLLAATAGWIPDPTYYHAGSFTNGAPYSALLWDRLGLPGQLQPALASPGGTNFAVGGARSRYHALNLDAFGLPPAVGTDPTELSLVWQVGLYERLTDRHSDPDALYLTWIGSNDVFDILAVAAAAPGSTQAYDLMSQSLGDVQASLETLYASGARHFLLPSLPDLGLTPEVRALEPDHPGAMDAATAWTQAYNDGLESIIQGLAGLGGIDLMRFDTFEFIRDAVANPAAFGFTNATVACLTGVFVYPPPLSQPGKICDGAATHLFWDQIHPSATGHRDLAAGMYEVVPEPGAITMLALGLILLRRSPRGALRHPRPTPP